MSTASTAATAVAYTIDPGPLGRRFQDQAFDDCLHSGRIQRRHRRRDLRFRQPGQHQDQRQRSMPPACITHDEKRDAHVKGADFLDTASYPKISFVSKKVTSEGKNQWKVIGDLTLHGVTKEATLDVESAGVESKDPWGNLRTGAEATTTIKRSDFGLKFNAPLETGGVMLSDEVHIHLDIELIKKA